VTRAQLTQGSAAAWRNSALLFWCLAWLPIAAVSLGPAVETGLGSHLPHVLVYAVMAAAAVTFARGRAGLVKAAVLAFAIGGLFELAQVFIPYRTADVRDVVANGAGALLGLAFGSVVLSRLRPRQPA
jgi:VanZ family protein